MVPTGTPPTNPYPVCSVMDLSLKIQAEMVPIGNSFHKPMPGTLPTECFLYISKAKIGLTGNFTVPPPTNCSQHPLYGMSPLPIQAEMVPIGNSFHKPTPGTLPRECFFYISKAKIGLTRNFTANSSHKPFPVCSLWDVSIQVENMPT